MQQAGLRQFIHYSLITATIAAAAEACSPT